MSYNCSFLWHSLAGTKLGPYEIRSPLGAGGMGEVYRARDSRLGRDVALKILPESVARDNDNDKERLHRFEQESRAVAALNHPNILAIHDVGHTTALRFLSPNYSRERPFVRSWRTERFHNARRSITEFRSLMASPRRTKRELCIAT